ncbi:MAG: patatin-like phospholipase family protein [Bacteroidota bacterium]
MRLLLLSLLLSSTLQVAHSQLDTSSVGLVLSGGGAWGMAHIGVIQYLEEIGVRVDRVGGTSMGGIVGGFYAMGYGVEDLQSIARDQNWAYLLSNEFDRREAPLALKDERDRYLMTLRREDKNIILADALVDGINIYQLLQELCSPVRRIDDFEELQLPFYCVAVDLKSGDPIILDKGYLPDALLATMAIPGLFQPVKIDDYLLVDGGVLNNFPVNEMRDKGADLIVGVTLVDKNYEPGGKGLSSILTQTYEVVMQNARSIYEGECDICIEVDVGGLSAADFDRADEFIKRGYAAAKAMHDELLTLRRPQAYGFVSPLPIEIPTEFDIQALKVEGNEHFSDEVVLRDLGLGGDCATLEDIQEAVQKLQASGRVDRVYYQLPSEENESTLTLQIDEKDSELLKVGLNYDSDFGAGILIHPRATDWFGAGSIFEAELRLDRNPYAQIAYTTNAYSRVTPEIKSRLMSEEYFAYENDRDFSSNRLIQLQTRAGARFTINPSMQLNFGIESQWYGISDNARRDVLQGFGTDLWNYYLTYKADYFNQSLFPTRGFSTQLISKAITENFTTYQGQTAPLWVSASHFQVLPLSRRAYLLLEGRIGLSTDSIAPQYTFYQGGLMTHQRDNFLPQLGMLPMRQQAQNGAMLAASVRYDVAADHHFYLGYGLSSLVMNADELSDSNWQSGIGIGYTWATPIAPIGVQFSSLTSDFRLIFLVTAGFDF